MKDKGQTLLEILVSLTIVGIIFGLGYVGFRSFSQRQEMQSVDRSLVADLRLAQEQALAGQKPAGVECDSPNTLSGFDFNVISSSSYTLDAVCSGGTVNTKSVTLPTGISISTPSTNPIIFKSVGQGTNLSASVSATLTQTGTTNAVTVTISQGGEIQ